MADTQNVEQSFNDYLPDCPPQNETEASLDALRTGIAAGVEFIACPARNRCSIMI
jgi:hypothetical protein